jgi:hypothetical protein
MPTFVVSLDRLEVSENGSLDKKCEAYLVATLYFPRSGVSQVVSARKLPPLTDGFALDTASVNPVTEKPFSWAEKVLFKEEVVGKAYLSVHVKTGKGGVEKFLDGLVKGLFGAAAGTLASPYVGVVVSAALGEIFPKGEGEDLASVGAAELDFDPADIAQSAERTLSLFAPAAVVKRVPAFDGPSTVTKDRVLLSAGQVNGKITLSFTQV